jgi:tetratricopeptide (TPR) repeat protein
MKPRRNTIRCRRRAGLALVGLGLGLSLVACAEGVPLAPRQAPQRAAPASDEASAASATPRWALRYYEGYTAEILAGDLPVAREAYRAVVDAPDADGELSARAALRLAEMEAAAGRRHIALDLVARAAALGRRAPTVLDGARLLQARLAGVRPQDSEVRGPPPGTPLDASPVAAALFARAEGLLAVYHRRAIRARLEDLNAEIRSKRHAMDEAVRAYRQVVQLGEPVAVVAAEYRIAALYYDLSLSMTFDLPTELDLGVASRLRNSLRAQALADRRKARAAYGRALEAARLAGPGAAPWKEAAALGLRSVDDLLGRRD